MALRTLLKQCIHEIGSSNRYWVNRSICTSPVCCITEADIDKKIIRVKPWTTYRDEDVFLSKEEQEYNSKLAGHITVEGPDVLGLVSGVPEKHIKQRRVYIYQPAKSAMQSGTSNTNCWRIEFDTQQRWENPLMGWTSSGDPLSNMTVDFPSKECAIQHCVTMGWQFLIEKPNKKNPRPRTYGENFSWDKRTRVSTK